MIATIGMVWVVLADAMALVVVAVFAWYALAVTEQDRKRED